MIETLEQGVLLALTLAAIALYFWLAFSLTAWLWRKFTVLVDARVYHAEHPVSNKLVLSMWQAAKATPIMFFAPAILLWRWLKNAMNRYIKAVDQLLAEHQKGAT